MVRRGESRTRAGGAGGSNSSTPTNGRRGSRGNSGYRGRNPHPKTAESRDRQRVWGYAPDAASNQSDLIRLFDRQRLLKARLVKQARLAKLAVDQVRSTEAEHLRMVNQAILDVSSSVEGFVNPFNERNLTSVQSLTEDMIKRQGRRTIPGSLGVQPITPSPRPIRSRRKFVADADNICSTTPTTENLLDLCGPLARSYRRAVARGYVGGPAAWLRGPKAERAGSALLRKGFTFSTHESWSIFDRNSPMYWRVNNSSGISPHNLRHGFQGERLRSEVTNFRVLRRQAASVQRLKRYDWPCVPGTQVHAWPTHPTLNESWEMMHRKKLPMHHNFDVYSAGLASRVKLPTRQVKPGVAVRVVKRLVIGLRADIEIPRKFLAYFRYRWGFLILYRKERLPPDLVKLIVHIWKTDISGLFLKHPFRFNEALRRIPTNLFYRLVGFVPALVHGAASKRRRRTGRNTRLLLKTSSSVPSTQSVVGAPSSDKSDGGVRLR